MLGYFIVAYVTHTPAAPLSAFIDCLWWLSDAPAHRRERIFPSGTQELVINLHEDSFVIEHPASPGYSRRFSGAMVSGAYRNYFVTDTRAHARLLGVHFKVGCARPFLGCLPGELSDVHVDLELLWGQRARELRERLCGAASVSEQFCLLEVALLACLKQPFRRHPAVGFALNRLTDDASSVGEVAAESGLSRRRLIELFTREVGMTPKCFARVRRFQRALSAARCGSPDFSELALRAGYCDQSHLIRDFVAFSGFSPTELLGNAGSALKENHAIDGAG